MAVSFWFYLSGFIFVTLSQLLCNTESVCWIFLALSLRFYLCDFILAALYAGSLWLKFLPCCVYGARCTPGIFKHCFGVTRPNPPAAHTRSQQKQQKKVKAGKVYGKGLSVHPNQQKKRELELLLNYIKFQL